MKKIFLCIYVILTALSLVGCAIDTPVETTGLEYEEVCEWTSYDWDNAKQIEKIEALYLIIDATNDDVDAGLSAKASVEGFDTAFENVSEDTTLIEIFNTASIDEVTPTVDDEK